MSVGSTSPSFRPLLVSPAGDPPSLVRWSHPHQLTRPTVTITHRVKVVWVREYYKYLSPSCVPVQSTAQHTAVRWNLLHSTWKHWIECPQEVEFHIHKWILFGFVLHASCGAIMMKWGTKVHNIKTVWVLFEVAVTFVIAYYFSD